ncbi:histidine utilization repressor [Aliikangiella sp. G2MR2-5]|uniref:histidine utilization repressor n=1 Tax=Aliikangiella sp. G2MR2-5 TaxID=2788943 RepID=UPI0018A88448|nr:histidine utilization repressor [Aliikangiella sp. G2MR2-5]
MAKSESLYLKVKTYILDGIRQGSWTAGERVPSENELCDLCKVSRMTARRALQELLNEGTLVRIKGKGSFVAEEKQQSSLIQIRSIAAEIKEQGFDHHAELIICQKQSANAAIAKALEVENGCGVGHSQILHFQDDHPIQLELRWVNLQAVPEYCEQDFVLETPSEYLSSIAPVTEAEHLVEAIIGSMRVRSLLKVSEDEAILSLERKTWCHDQLISYAKLYHPGNRYRLGSKFKTG